MYSLRFFKNKEDYTNSKDSFLESTVSFVNDEEKTYFKLDPLTIVSFKVQSVNCTATVKVTYTSGDVLTPTTGMTWGCDRYLSRLDSGNGLSAEFYFDDSSGGGQTTTVWCQYNSKIGRSNAISLNEWS